MTEQIITTPNGERLVILPEAEFIALREALEDQQDIEAARAFQRRLAAGEEELVPADIVKRIIAGENKVRVWREFRGFSQRDLAAKAAVSTGYLSQIETGGRDGTFNTMKRIAAALDISVDDLA
jgi:DNA-binding XRE family transcriptional regulator